MINESNETIILQELRDRCRRIETKQHLMCKAMGLESTVTSGMTVSISGNLKDGLRAYMHGADIPISAVKRSLVRCGFDPGTCGEVVIYADNIYLAAIRFT